MLQIISIVVVRLDLYSKMNHPLHIEFGRCHYVSKLLFRSERIKRRLLKKSYKYLACF